MSPRSLENKRSSMLQDPQGQNTSADEYSDGQEGGNAKWADSIAKILGTTKPKNKRTLVLSRAKKLNDIAENKKKEANYDFEVDGEIKEEQPLKELEINLKQAKNQKVNLRVKPTWKDIDRERALRKIATRGVVQLFNAVRTEQKNLQSQLAEAGPLDIRKEAVFNNINKRKFLDVLMSGKRSISEQLDNPVKNETFKESESSEDDSDNTRKKPEWCVLRADFMTNKKIKHWDEDDASQDEESNDDV